MHGMASAGISTPGGGGECDSLKQVDVQSCCDCIYANRDVIVGVKVRLSVHVSNNGENEKEIYKRSLEVADRCHVPVMTHHTTSSIPVHAGTGEEQFTCPGSLRAGDIYTHTYHGWKSTIIDTSNGKVFPDVLAARGRGVLFDLGHGQGSFSWTVAEKCADIGFWPDFISTDLHSGNIDGPVYDLTVVMSKMLHIGMPLNDVIRATTINTAKAIRKEDVIGSLSVGHPADITVLRLEECDLDLEDSFGQLRHLKSRLVPVAVWKDGQRFEIEKLVNFPNKKVWVNQSKNWKLGEVTDGTRPAHAPQCC